jgi:predicted TIM-barrel fold metal-dependent hydrolase
MYRIAEAARLALRDPGGGGVGAELPDRVERTEELLEEKPSTYIRRNCYFVAEPEERTIGAMLDLVGEDRILWGSDYPHVDSTLDAPNLIRRSVAGLGAERQARVLGENARRVFLG